MKLPILFAACLVMATNAFGRIGETLEECKARYGKATQSPGGATFFIKDNVWIVIRFSANKAVTLMYRMWSPKDGDFREFTETEIAVLLKDNGGGTEWIPATQEMIKGSNVTKAWGKKDAKFVATYHKDSTGPFLSIMDYYADKAEGGKKKK